MPKRLVYIVWYKVGSLDLILPITARIRQVHPDIHLTILVAELNKSYLIRSGRFYKFFCKKHNIELLDMLDFLPVGLHPFIGLIRYFVNYPARDGKTNHKLYDFISAFIGNLIGKLIQHNKIRDYLNESTLLMNEQWWDQLNILDCIPLNKTILLVPHGPVYLCYPDVVIDQKTIQHHKHILFQSGQYTGILYDALMPQNKHVVLPYDRVKVPIHSLGVFNNSTQYHQDEEILVERLAFVGAPCFDTKWFEYVFELLQTDQQIKQIVPKKGKRFRCLFLMRDVVETDQSKKVTLTDFKIILQTIIDEILHPYDCEIIIKPHPRQSPYKLRQILKQFNLKEYIIVDDNIAITLLESDVAVTVHTSGSYYPMIFGIPCIHIYKRDYPNQPLYNEMEQTLQRVVFNLEDLPQICAKLMHDLVHGNPVPNDVEHMRKFYPDGSIELVMEQLRPYLEGDSE